MRCVIMALVIVGVTGVLASADYVVLDSWSSYGAGYYDYHYTYYRTGNPLTANESSWSLLNIVGLDAQFSDASGPVYWDEGTFINDNTGVRWTYTGGETPGEELDSYTTFDVIVYHPGGHTALTEYEIDLDGDGTADATGQVLAPTPEPGTLALVLLGSIGIAARLRRRKSG